MFLKQFKIYLTILAAFALAFVVTSCKVKEGCPGMNQHVKTGKDGKLPSKPGRAKSGLFPRGT